MKKVVYVIDKEGNYLCVTPKGTDYTSENRIIRRRLIYWSNLDNPKKRAITNLFAIFNFIMIKILSGDLKPKLVLEDGGVKWNFF